MLQIDVLASGSKGNAYIVSDGVTDILLECGIPWKEIQRKSGFRKIDACFVSHEHGDHAKAVKDVLKMGIPTYMPWDMAEKIESHNAKGMLDKSLNTKDDWDVVTFSLEHDVPSLGYCITFKNWKKYPNGYEHKLVYITDTMYCKYKFSNVTHWMIECNYSREILDENVRAGRVDQTLRNRIVKSHMSIETVKDLLRANDLSKTQAVYLMHLSDANSDEAMFKHEIQRIVGVPVYVC